MPEELGRQQLTAQEVLRRYMEEELPAFVGMSLVDVNQVGHFGERPLDVACTRGNMEEIEALAEGGAELDAQGEVGYTPLHEAVSQGHLDAVRFLLARGASRDIRNDFGRTPLDTARLTSRNELAKLLQEPASER